MLTLEGDVFKSLNLVRWWIIDASYAVHPKDMRSHTGSFMTMGKGAMHASSSHALFSIAGHDRFGPVWCPFMCFVSVGGSRCVI